MSRPRVFLDFTVDDESFGRVIFELHSDKAPKTCENFRALCTGEKGTTSSGTPLYYKNSTIHRSIASFMLQGGDFTKHNGSGGQSIYGSTFADENLTLPLDSSGLLCMANKGPDTNGSQFFITLGPAPHLNGKHVVFGKVIRGYEVVERIATVPVGEKDRPILPITISNCGELEKKPAAKRRERSESDSDEPRSRRKKRSLSPSEEDKHRHRKEKRNKKHSKAPETIEPSTEEPHQETEEEYDARLEREELEREELARAEQKKRDLERIKQKQIEAQTQDGVRFKGRGRMKFVDPEVAHRRNN